MSSPHSHPNLFKNIADTFNWQLVKVCGQEFPELTFLMVGNKAISVPHLSYGLWPPTDGIQRENLEINKERLFTLLDSRFQDWELRLPAPNIAGVAKKTASWLDLNNIHYSSNLRSKLKRANRMNFNHLWGTRELVADFWNCYARHIHKLGSLPLPRSFFENLLTGFEGGTAEICLLLKDQRIVGAACNIRVEGFYENVWFATNDSAQKEYGSYYLHEQMIVRSQILGCSTYSFGRSTTGSGVHNFKKQWGAADVPLEWYCRNSRVNPLYQARVLGKLLGLLPFWFIAWLGGKMAYHIY